MLKTMGCKGWEQSPVERASRRAGCCRLRFLAIATALFICAAPQSHGANGPSASAEAPGLVRVEGALPAGKTAQPADAVVDIAIYDSREGGSEVWAEKRSVRVNAQGRYSLVLNFKGAEGLPLDTFVSGKTYWLAVRGNGDTEQRVAVVIADESSRRTVVKAPDESASSSAGQADPRMAADLRDNGLQADKAATVGAPIAYSVEGGGTGGTIPKFSGSGASTTLTNSVISEAFGNVGIGTTSPSYILHIAGSYLTNMNIGVNYSQTQRIGAFASGIVTNVAAAMETDNDGSTTHPLMAGLYVRPLTFTRRGSPISNTASLYISGAASTPVTGGNQALWVASGNSIFSGNVGVGTTGPQAALDVRGSLGVYDSSAHGFYVSTAGGGNVTMGNNWGPTTFQVGAGHDMKFIDDGGVNRLYLRAGGTVGIGTSSPDTGNKLHVAGNVRVDGNIAAKYQDVAEWVSAQEPLVAGTVVVVDADRDNGVAASRHAYDTAVAGVVSERPGLILGEEGPNKLRVATTGRVKVRVDASNGPVRAGDLLVSSDREGVAMRSEPLDLAGTKLHRPGTVIGKALQALDQGEGEILVLLTLQ